MKKVPKPCEIYDHYIWQTCVDALQKSINEVITYLKEKEEHEESTHN